MSNQPPPPPPPPRPPQRKSPFSVRWHRWLGLSAVVFVLVLSVTGLMLNHASLLGLKDAMVEARWIQGLYDSGEDRTPTHYLAGNLWVSEISGALYLNGTKALHHGGHLAGALKVGDIIAAAMDREVLLFNAKGAFVDMVRLDAPAEAIGITPAGRLFVRTNKAGLMFDEALLQSSPAPAAEGTVWAQPANPPDDIARAALTDFQGEPLTWLEVIRDIHNGRFIGLLGLALMDVTALVLIILSGTGIYVWWLRKPR